jgi:hypothetical protein
MRFKDIQVGRSYNSFREMIPNFNCGWKIGVFEVVSSGSVGLKC